MKKSLRLWGALLVLAGVLATVFYQRVYQPKSTYLTVPVQSGDFDVWVQGLGELDAQRLYPLGFTAGGRLIEVAVDQGERLAAHTLLAQLDPAELHATLAEMQALHNKTRLEIQATQQDIALNQERYNLAKLAHDRNQTLIKKGSISQAQFDQTESAMLQADIALKSAYTRLQLIKAELERIEKSLEVIRVKRDNLKLYTPEEVLIVERLAEAGESLVPGQPVFKVLNPASLWVKAYIDERVSGRLAINQPAEIRLRSQPGKVFHGYVKRIDAQSDPVTLERVVYVAFNPPLPPPFLYEQAQINIHTHALKNVLQLPNSTLAIYQTQQGVWLKDNGRARFVAVKVLASNPTHFAFEPATRPEPGLFTLQSGSEIIVPDKNKKPLFNGARIFP